MGMADPIELSEYTGSSMSWDVEGMLRHAIKQMQSGERVANKAIVIFLDDIDDGWDIGFTQAQMTHSEMVALMETLKHHLCNEMIGYYEV
jgi:hypothetical protein